MYKWQSFDRKQICRFSDADSEIKMLEIRGMKGKNSFWSFSFLGVFVVPVIVGKEN